ncbi:MAG: hypothetical protein DRJ15_16765, partial [Bacteroidetes bacterium]
MMAGLNIQFDAFTQEGKIKSLGKMFKELDKATRGMIDKDRIALFKEMFGLRAMKGGANLLEAMAGKFDALNKKVIESSEGLSFIQGKYQEFTDTTTGQLELLKTAFADSMEGVFNSEEVMGFLKDFKKLVAGDDFASSIKGITSALNDLATALASLINMATSLPGDIVDLGLIGYVILGKSPVGRIIAGMIEVEKQMKHMKGLVATDEGLKWGETDNSIGNNWNEMLQSFENLANSSEMARKKVVADFKANEAAAKQFVQALQLADSGFKAFLSLSLKVLSKDKKEEVDVTEQWLKARGLEEGFNQSLGVLKEMWGIITDIDSTPHVGMSGIIGGSTDVDVLNNMTQGITTMASRYGLLQEEYDKLSTKQNNAKTDLAVLSGEMSKHEGELKKATDAIYAMADSMKVPRDNPLIKEMIATEIASIKLKQEFKEQIAMSNALAKEWERQENKLRDYAKATQDLADSDRETKYKEKIANLNMTAQGYAKIEYEVDKHKIGLMRQGIAYDEVQRQAKIYKELLTRMYEDNNKQEARNRLLAIELDIWEKLIKTHKDASVALSAYATSTESLKDLSLEAESAERKLGMTKKQMDLEDIELKVRQRKLASLRDEQLLSEDRNLDADMYRELLVRIYEASEKNNASLKVGKDVVKDTVKAQEKLLKLYAKWGAPAITKEMGAREKIMTQALKEYEEMRDALKGMKLSENAYNKELAIGTDNLRKHTQELLDGVAAAEQMNRIKVATSLALKDEEEMYGIMASRLKGMARLQAEYNRERVKFERSTEYIKTLKNEKEATDESRAAMKLHMAVVNKSVYSIENLVEAYKESGTALQGFIAGLVDIKLEMKSVSEYTFEFAHDLRDATADSFSTMLKSVTYGLRRAKNELKTVLDDSLEAATETYNKALTELEKSFAAGELSTLEYEANKLDILENFNESKFDSQTEYNKSI